MNILYTLFALGLVHSVVATQAKDLVVGMGFITSRPVCCYACRDALSSLYLDCTTLYSRASDNQGSRGLVKKVLIGQTSATTDPACRSSNTQWLQTLAYCMQQKCSLDRVDNGTIASVWQDIAGEPNNLPNFNSSFPKNIPTEMLGPDEMYLNRTSLVNDKLYHAVYQALQSFETQEEVNMLLSSIIIASVIGFCLIIAWYRATTSVLRLYSLFPSSFSRFFRSKLTVPALFGTRHSQSLRFEIGYAPSRFLSLAIFIYVAVNVVFSVVPIKQPQQNTWAIDDRTETVGFISNRTGVLGFANMALAILTAGRNNPLLMVTGWNYTTFITFHRWAARVATVQAIIHSLIYTITFFCSGVASSYYTDITLRNYAWGILGTVAMTLMISFSVLAVRRRWYESFVVIHIVLGILVLLGCWLHVDFRTSRLGYELWLYLAVGFWGFDRLARLSRITYRNYIRGRSKAYAQLLPGKKLVKLTVFPSIPWNFRAGQYCFLYIPALGRFYESHPFSIAYQNTGSLHGTVSVLGPREGRDDVEKKNGLVTATSLSSPLPSPTTTVFTEFLEIEDESEQGSVSFIIRAKDGVTKQLRNSLLASGETRVPLSVTIEGPYGRLPSLAAAETILCIAGGIGITSILGLIQQHIEEQRNGGRFKRLLLVWTAKEQPLIDFVHSRLPDNPDAYGIELRITCTGGQTMGFRPNLEALVHEEARRTKSLAVVVCGPARMSDCVRKGVVESIKAGNQIELHEEAFAW